MPPISPNQRLIEYLIATDKVAAIGVGGSLAAGTADQNSDFDLYVFTTGDIDRLTRQDIARRVADPGPVEIGNQWWGDEDGYAIDGTWYDIVYFGADWFFDGIDEVLNHHRPSPGYSTSFIYTLHHLQGVYDPDGIMARWQAQTREYPSALADAIIDYNLPLISTVHSSLRNQISRAIELNDAVAVNHRVAAFLAAIFDITNATLRQWHPGEKRQIQHLAHFRDQLPPDFAGHILQVLHCTAPDRIDALLASVDQIASEVHRIAQRDH